GGVDAAERDAAVGVPQALRRHRRRVAACAVLAALAERAVARGRAGAMALTAEADASRAARHVAVADDHARQAAGRAAVDVAAAGGAGLAVRALVGVAARRRAVSDVADEPARAVGVDPTRSARNLAIGIAARRRRIGRPGVVAARAAAGRAR